ncbi:hypothetical protein CLOSBL3_12706 [Clostridiaceae bacterium BL-3]|nr:hypothetical protein CLOSBL3_12706 [Clostridiaceae bacterium BL-3]
MLSAKNKIRIQIYLNSMAIKIKSVIIFTLFGKNLIQAKPCIIIINIIGNRQI